MPEKKSNTWIRRRDELASKDKVVLVFFPDAEAVDLPQGVTEPPLGRQMPADIYERIARDMEYLGSLKPKKNTLFRKETG